MIISPRCLHFRLHLEPEAAAEKFVDHRLGSPVFGLDAGVAPNDLLDQLLGSRLRLFVWALQGPLREDSANIRGARHHLARHGGLVRFNA